MAAEPLLQATWPAVSTRQDLYPHRHSRGTKAHHAHHRGARSDEEVEDDTAGATRRRRRARAQRCVRFAASLGFVSLGVVTNSVFLGIGSLALGFGTRAMAVEHCGRVGGYLIVSGSLGLSASAIAFVGLAAAFVAALDVRADIEPNQQRKPVTIAASCFALSLGICLLGVLPSTAWAGSVLFASQVRCVERAGEVGEDLTWHAMRITIAFWAMCGIVLVASVAGALWMYCSCTDGEDRRTTRTGEKDQARGTERGTAERGKDDDDDGDDYHDEAGGEGPPLLSDVINRVHAPRA